MTNQTTTKQHWDALFDYLIKKDSQRSQLRPAVDVALISPEAERIDRERGTERRDDEGGAEHAS